MPTWLKKIFSIFSKKKSSPAVPAPSVPSTPVAVEPVEPPVEVPTLPEGSNPVSEQPQSPEVPSTPVEPVTPPAEAPAKPEEPKETEEEKLMRWTRLCLNISQTFEGSIPWANPTGNFDGTGLTMGALGWTIQYGDQQALVKKFVSRHGQAEAKKLMPQKWGEYWDLCALSNSEGIKRADKWATGSTKSGIKEPYRHELISFWTDERMIQIQIEKAHKDMTLSFAWEQAQRFAKAMALPEVPFGAFAFFFDWRVLNGADMKGVSYSTAYEFCNGKWDLGVSKVLEYCDLVTSSALHPVYSVKSARWNGAYWAGRANANVKLAPLDKAAIKPYQKALLVMGFLRAKKSRSQFVADVLCRRGTLALGAGIVHEGGHDLRHIYAKA